MNRRSLQIKLSMVFVFILMGLVAMPSFAQEVAVKQDSIQKSVALDLETKKSDVKIFLDKIEILGRIEKPQTVFIIPGKNPTVDDIQIDRSFFKEIFRKIEIDQIRKEIEKIEGKNQIR